MTQYSTEYRQLLLRLDQAQTRLAEALDALAALRGQLNDLGIGLTDTGDGACRTALLAVMRAKTLHQARQHAKVVFEDDGAGNPYGGNA